MKAPVRQNQHRVPRVYLKMFGYRNLNQQWMVSVMKQGERFTRQKSIGSFTAEVNLFDIDSDDPRIRRMFERINGDLETTYPVIMRELAQQNSLTERSVAYLLQLVANLIVRTDNWRDQILELLNSDVNERFLKSVVGHLCRDQAEFDRIEELDFYRILVDLTPAENINRVLLYFIDHLLVRLEHFDIVFLRSTPEKPWFTSTDPVVVHNRTHQYELFAAESEFYFPLSPELVAYFHFQGSADRENLFRTYQHNTIQQLNDEQIIALNRQIIDNVTNYLIFPGEHH